MSVSLKLTSIRVLTATALLLSTTLSTSQAQSAAPDWQWAKRIPLASSIIPAAATDAGGNSIIIGSFLGNATFGNTILTSYEPSSSGDSFVAKHDAQGAVLWVRQITGSREERPVDVKLDAAGNVYVVGTMETTTTFVDGNITLTSSVAGSTNLYVAKYDPAGTLLWARNFGGSHAGIDMLYGQAIAVSSTGVVYVAADLKGQASFDATQVEIPTGTTPVLLQLSPNGAVQWAKAATIETVTQVQAIARVAGSLSVDATGAAYLGGTLSGSLRFGSHTVSCSPTQQALFLARYDAQGNPQWVSQSASTGSGNVLLTKVTTDAAGNSYVTGDFGPGSGSNLNASFGPYTLTSQGQNDAFLVKYDATGAPRWARSVGGTGFDHSGAITFSSNGDLLLGGYFTNTIALTPGVSLTSRGDIDIFLTRFNDQGTVQWAQQAGGPHGYEMINSLTTDANGNIYVHGQATYNTAFGSLLQVSSAGPFSFAARLSNTVLNANNRHETQALTLYPSPARGTADVKLGALPKGTVLHLSDVTGRIVHQQTVSSEVAQLSLPGLHAGLYALKATAPNGEYYTGRLVVE